MKTFALLTNEDGLCSNEDGNCVAYEAKPPVFASFTPDTPRAYSFKAKSAPEQTPEYGTRFFFT